MNKLVIICGPTAVGKTKFAIETARDLRGEIVNCDSMQIYKRMDIGSAKPTADERAAVRHHLVDFVDPREKYSAAMYQKAALAAIDDIRDRGKIPILSGGTTLYIDSVIYDMDFSASPEHSELRAKLYRIAQEDGVDALHEKLKKTDPDAAVRIHPNNIKKVVRAIEAASLGSPVKDYAERKPRKGIHPLIIGLRRERDELYARIDRRVDSLMEAGLVNEVCSLLAYGLDKEAIAMKGIGYKEVIAYLNGEYDISEAIRLIKRNTRHFAKRQMTRLRGYDTINWFDISDDDDAWMEEALDWLRQQIKN